jgi:hypothetical protein
MDYGISAMGINSGAVLAILLLVAGLALFVLILRLLYSLAVWLYGWLSRRNFVIELRQRREGRKKRISRKRGMSLGEFLGEIFAEPVILTVAIVISYDHFKGIWETSPDLTTFLVRINENSRGNMLIGIVILIALLIWMMVVASRHDRDLRRDKEFEELQKTNTDKVVEAIEKLAAEIRESNKGERRSPPA